MLQKEVLIEEKSLHAGIGEHIGYELGAKMIKDYYDATNQIDCHFVGRNILDQILAQPGCIGIKIHKGLNELGVEKYVITGSDEFGNDILNVMTISPDGSIKNREGIVADRDKESIGWFDITRL